MGKKQKNHSDNSQKLSNKEYKAEISKLYAELVKLQYWIKEKGLKIIVIFEGRDSAGKGGTILSIGWRLV